MTRALSELNFRDLGGVAAGDGRVLRCGVLYRSEGPASFIDAHHAELEALSFRLVCDLRSGAERRAAPHTWRIAARMLHVEVDADLRSDLNEGWRALREDPTRKGALRAMRLNYAMMPLVLHRHWDTLTAALAGGDVPALIHCTAGKDRTGVLIGLLLTALGATYDTVLDDYLRSGVFQRDQRRHGALDGPLGGVFGHDLPPDAIDALLGVDAAFLDTAFASVRRHWGSTEAYFDSAGVDAARRAALQAALLIAA